MSKRAPLNSVAFQVKAARKAERAERVAALRDGRKLRAATFTDRKREYARSACRGRVTSDG